MTNEGTAGQRPADGSGPAERARRRDAALRRTRRTTAWTAVGATALSAVAATIFATTAAATTDPPGSGDTSAGTGSGAAGSSSAAANPDDGFGAAPAPGLAHGGAAHTRTGAS